MPNKPPAPKRIEEIGLKVYLDESASLRDGFGYDHFVSMVGDRFISDGKLKVDKANLARTFKVSRGAIYRWLEVYKKELRRAK